MTCFALCRGLLHRAMPCFSSNAAHQSNCCRRRISSSDFHLVVSPPSVPFNRCALTFSFTSTAFLAVEPPVPPAALLGPLLVLEGLADICGVLASLGFFSGGASGGGSSGSSGCCSRRSLSCTTSKSES
eukprot:13085_1